MRRLSESDTSEYITYVIKRYKSNNYLSSKTPWSLVAIFFLFLIGFSSTLTFVFGRIVDITTFTQRKYDKYDEVPIFGDLSDEDINNANNLTEVLNVRVLLLPSEPNYSTQYIIFRSRISFLHGRWRLSPLLPICRSLSLSSMETTRSISQRLTPANFRPLDREWGRLT